MKPRTYTAHFEGEQTNLHSRAARWVAISGPYRTLLQPLWPKEMYLASPYWGVPKSAQYIYTLTCWPP
jgi:hypothetical protein